MSLQGQGEGNDSSEVKMRFLGELRFIQSDEGMEKLSFFLSSCLD